MLKRFWAWLRNEGPPPPKDTSNPEWRFWAWLTRRKPAKPEPKQLPERDEWMESYRVRVMHHENKVYRIEIKFPRSRHWEELRVARRYFTESKPEWCVLTDTAEEMEKYATENLPTYEAHQAWFAEQRQIFDRDQEAYLLRTRGPYWSKEVIP